MKELDNHNLQAEKQGIEMTQQKQKQQEYTYLNSVKPMSGHRIWEIDTTTLEVREAEFEVRKHVNMLTALTDIGAEKIVQKPHCVYISALNQKTALKRYKTNKGSASLPLERKELW